MKTWDRTKPRIYDPKLGTAAVPAPHIPLQEPAKLPLNSSEKKRGPKSKSTSVWSIRGGLPETNREGIDLDATAKADGGLPAKPAR